MAAKTGLDRDEATLMLALLVGQADGVSDPAEEQAILARLAPQLGRLGPDGQQRAVEVLADLLAKLGLDRTLSSIRAAYPFHEAAVEGFRVAAGVAFADGKLTADEAQRVAHIATALRLSEAELRASLPKPGKR